MEEFNGIIINTRDFQNSSIIVTILTKDELKTGLLKGGKKNNICIIGNYVYCKRFGKKESLGVLSCEIITPYGVNYINNNILISIIVICSEIKLSLKETIYNQNIYNYFFEFLKKSFTKSLNDLEVREYFLIIEYEILKECGILNEVIMNENLFLSFYNIINNKNELDKIQNIRNLLFKS